MPVAEEPGPAAPGRPRRASRKRPVPDATITLAATLDMLAAAPLAQALLARRGQAVVIDASAVDRLGGQCLQVLLAARRTWLADGFPFAVARPSEGFAQALLLLGADHLLGGL